MTMNGHRVCSDRPVTGRKLHFDIIERGIPPVALLDTIACTGEDTDLFFPDNNSDSAAAAAVAICNRCPHRRECLQWALDTKQMYGIWGGLTPAQRSRLRREPS